jgi:diguanylate cyclase (GGDEF)-like protein/putative nucleotidyltransferase with HDIG domain
VNVWSLIPLVSCVFFIVLFLSVLPQVKKRIERIFALFLFASMIWSFTAVMLLHDTSASSHYLIFWNGLVITCIPLVVVTYYHFIRAYNNKKADISVFVGYAIVFTIMILSFTGYVVKDAYFIGNLLYHDIYYWDYILAPILVPFLSMTIIMLYKRYKNSIDPTDRNRTSYLILGWSLLVMISYITPFTPSLKTLPIDHIGNLINALIITYTIFKFNLLNIQTVFRKLLTYIIVIGALFTITVIVFLINPDFFIHLPLFVIIIILSLIYIFVILSSAPLIKFVSKGVDYLFYRKTYDYRQELLNFNKKMSHILNLDELAKEILPTISKALNVTGAGLMLQDNKSGNFETQFIYPEEGNDNKQSAFKKISFEADSAIILWMDKKENALSPEQIDTIPELRGLWISEKEKILASDIGLFFPFKSRDKLIGILTLGKKKNKAILSYQDIELIANIANQAGIIIENAQLYTHAKIKANTDELTALYNHRHFHERLDQEITRNTRFGGTFSLIMMDVDLFKSYNDIYGHLAGDNVLRKVGEYIVNSIRGIDLAFRYGGEEFTVILPGTQIEDAYKVAERIRKTIEAKSSLKAMPITISLGVSNWPSDGIMKEEIIGRADEALYLAKQLGRNRTCMSTDIKKGQDTQLISSELRSNPKALSIIYALAATVDAKDSYTYGHSRKVSEYAIAIAESLKLPNDKIDSIRSAGLLHDIGKIGIPDYILNKNTYLSGEENQLIKRHPKIGAEILKHVIDLVSCIPAILHHHERYDGTGYPSGLTGENIPIEARILSVADAYDAMVSLRPYRRQLSLQEAIDELKNCSGSQFDPIIVETFVEIIQKKNTDAIAYNRDEYIAKVKDNKNSN